MSLTDQKYLTSNIYSNTYYDNRSYYGYGGYYDRYHDWKVEYEKLYREFAEYKRRQREANYYHYYPVTWDEYKPKGETVTFKIGDRVEVKEGFKNAGKVGYYQGRSLLNKDTHLVRFEGKSKDTKVVLDALQLKPYTREEKVERFIEDYEGIYGCTLNGAARNALAALLLADGVVLP